MPFLCSDVVRNLKSVLKPIYTMLDHKFMRIVQYALIISFACLVNGCGFVKTVYNNVPEVISWWLDDYFDFTPSQKSVLNPALHRLHDWHRQKQLPSYIVTLQDLQHDVIKEQISTSEACAEIESIKSSFSELQLEFTPIIIEIAPLLSDKQLQYFQTKLEKRALKWKDEWVQDTVEEQRAVRLEKIESFAEKVYGSLNKSQEVMLKQKLATTPIKPTISYAEIQRRNEDVYQIVVALQNQSLSAESKSQLVKDGFERLQNSPNPIYQAYANQIQQHTCEIISDLHASTNEKQKLHAKDWLQSYITQLSDLSKTKLN